MHVIRKEFGGRRWGIAGLTKVHHGGVWMSVVAERGLVQIG